MVDIYSSEEEQLEQIKSWFKENGKFLLGGILLGCVAVFGYRGWTTMQVTEARTASASYEAVRDAATQGQTEKAQTMGAELIAEYPNSPYAAHTALSLAVVALEAGDAQEATKQLQWVLDSDARSSIKHVARMRLARVQLFSQNNPDAALKTLAVEKTGEFEMLYAELEGDAKRAKGDIEGAKAAYNQALELWDADLGSTEMLQMKLNSLEAQ